jgi:hypothetical protein
MPRISTLPTLFEECKTLTISFLSKNGYLKPNQCNRGVVTWSRDGQKTGSISIAVNTLVTIPFIVLDYNSNDEPRKYQINLVTFPSNLGKGVHWYFVCPNTNKRCRKLHLHGGYFLHRSAFKDCFYEKQTQNKYWRFLDKSPLGRESKCDLIYEQIYKKHFKKTYRGKPTKKYLRLLRKYNQLNH